MENKQKIDLSIGLIMILNAIIILLLPLFNISDIKIIAICSFLIVSLVNLGGYLLTKDSKDYEGLFTFVVSLITLILFSTFKIEDNPKTLAMCLMIWVSLMAIIKLKKSDYYNDRNDRMWKIKILDLVLFVITGILSCINLAYDYQTQIIVFGFFMLINGILEFFEPVVKTLIKHS